MLTVSPAVAEHVGRQRAADFQARTGSFACIDCGETGDARRETAVAVVRTNGSLSHLGVAHQRCAVSEVRPSPGVGLAEVTDLVPRAGGIPTTRGFRPVLLVAFEEDVIVDGDHPVLRHLLAQGLHRQVPLGRPAPPSPGWSAHIGPGDSLVVDAPARPLLREGRMLAPPAWRDLVAADRHVTLLAGRLDHDVLYADQPPFRAYGQAVRNGDLLAGEIAVTLT